jgi:hypothetical protein
MIPVNWTKLSSSDIKSFDRPDTYIKWIIDKAIEAGYLTLSSDVEWGDITGNILDQVDLITYISNITTNLDGGFANSVYLISELADGGSA